MIGHTGTGVGRAKSLCESATACYVADVSFGVASMAQKASAAKPAGKRPAAPAKAAKPATKTAKAGKPAKGK